MCLKVYQKEEFVHIPHMILDEPLIRCSITLSRSKTRPCGAISIALLSYYIAPCNIVQLCCGLRSYCITLMEITHTGENFSACIQLTFYVLPVSVYYTVFTYF